MTFTNAGQRFGRHVTVHRFVRASDSAAAQLLGTAGLQLASGTLAHPEVAFEHVAIEQWRVAPYRHAGEDNLWWVSIDVGAALRAEGPDAADEAAYQLVTVSRDAAASDVFEYEIQVLGRPGDAMPQRAADAASAA